MRFGWLPTYLREFSKRHARRVSEKTQLILCLADHFEPNNGNAPVHLRRERVNSWAENYPRLFGNFRDSSGRAPRHSFFYPMESYERDLVATIAQLCRDGYGEVEIHLHHDKDNSETFRSEMIRFREELIREHHLLSRHRNTGAPAYAFVHGNWALANSLPSGRWCGVDDELSILRDTGCYADFTLPAYPSLAQTKKINSIYYVEERNLSRRKGHNWGVAAGATPLSPRGLMLIQGPLILNWKGRKWGLVPRIENGCLQSNQLASGDRLSLWLKARVQVPTRPDWFFVKLHMHGASEDGQKALLGEGMVRFHQDLASMKERDSNFQFHYVTAREMYNLVRAAEAGWEGEVQGALDFELISNLAVSPSQRLNSSTI